ncbi:unnamed protein product, partial [Coregonus sp. 'balchen']
GKYQQQSLGPIQQSTILVVDPVKGNVLKASGRNMFYLPHGITTDKDNNYWVTDVALHQPLVVLGEAFEPGSDKEHFCKPTDVAVDPVTGNVYVSDGYCNARILKRELCVADRENGRIQCFVAESGEFVKEIKKQEFGGEVFAISYAPVHGGLIYAVNGESAYGRSAPLKGFVINYSTKEILDDFSPENAQEFGMPHDIVVTKDGHVFVGDAATDSVLKFSSDKAEHRSVKKGGIEVQEIEETETIIQTRLKPQHEIEVALAKVQTPVATQQKTAEPVQEQPQKPQQQQEEEDDKEKTLAKQSAQGVSPAVITTLLLIPLVVVISIGVKLEQTSSGGILGKLRETETIIQTRLKPQHEIEVALAKVQTPVATQQKTAEPVQEQPQKPQQQQEEEDDKEKTLAKQSAQGVSPAVITTLLLIPLVVVISIGVKLEQTSSGGILGKLRGKAAGGLNLGNFFATHKGYTRQGFDRLSTEGSDQEKDDENDTDSENEEYSAPPPPVGPASSS